MRYSLFVLCPCAEHIADGLEGCENVEEGQMETGVPAYELKGCAVM